MSKIRLAVDLGASSGRVLAAHLDDRQVRLEEVHRFSNGPVNVGRRLHWDVLRLWTEIEAGLAKAGSLYGDRVESVGVDTWGVDYVLLDKNLDLVGPPFCYRDSRTAGILPRAFQKLSRESIFDETGLQFMEFNTAFQLFAMREERSPLLDVADKFLMIPDFFHWLLSGAVTNEQTNASTTQLLRPTDSKWSSAILNALDIPSHLFSDVTPSGTELGRIAPHIAERIGLKSTRVVVPATHDTGAAVVAVPASGFAEDNPKWCYISSGTWSLMGVELRRPNLTQKCRELNFTNEGGILGTTRLLKNISGLWPFQQCRATWLRQGKEFSWSQLTAMASEAKPLQAFFDPDDPSLVAPSDMVNAIQNLLKRHNQMLLQEVGAIARCALESLVMRYRICLGWLEELLGYTIDTIHIVGGGVQNELLCQLTADATKRVVVAGPIEATALGNVVCQAFGSGDLKDVVEARAWILASSNVKRFEPHNTAAWDEAFDRFQQIIDASR